MRYKILCYFGIKMSISCSSKNLIECDIKTNSLSGSLQFISFKTDHYSQNQNQNRNQNRNQDRKVT